MKTARDCAHEVDNWLDDHPNLVSFNREQFLTQQFEKAILDARKSAYRECVEIVNRNRRSIGSLPTKWRLEEKANQIAQAILAAEKELK